MPIGDSPVAVYVHTPFCPSKCAYCDFNSYAMSGEIVERTTKATITELRRSPWKGMPAKTIFLGGGTPTFLPSALLEELIGVIQEVHPPVPGCEITSEANPGTVDLPKFASLARSGVNRVSLGAQSFWAGDLKRLGRVHEADQVALAVIAAREAGITNLNLDLMFALSGQSMRTWEWNLKTAIGLKPEHLSLYCLTIEPNTRYYRLHSRGMLDLPDDEAQTGMYDRSIEIAQDHGYSQYEISNFSLPGRECSHNLCYWRCEDYAAYGPGAVGCMTSEDERVRYTNIKHPERFSSAVEASTSLWCESEVIGPTEQRTERIMMGLRLNEGLSITDLDLDKTRVGQLLDRGWVSLVGDRMKLTPAGRHFCSETAVLLMD